MSEKIVPAGPATAPALEVPETSLLRRVLAGFDSTGVRWALLRGRSGLGVPGRDVDLLIAEEDLERAEDVVFALRGVALPRSLHPWHRFYVLDDSATGENLKLDVVVEVVYHRQLRLRTGLEAGVLDRRWREGSPGWLSVLDPTDAFWTVLLHCLLDKQAFKSRRRDELTAALPRLVTPSAGEEVFDALCPPGWCGTRAANRVGEGDWPALVALGCEMVARAGDAAGDASVTGGPGTGGTGRPGVRRALTRTPRRWARLAVAAAYPTVWRRAGLGAVPRVLDVVDDAGVDVLVRALRRRPVICGVDLLVADPCLGPLRAALRSDGFRPVAGAWTRVGLTGLERVRVSSTSQEGWSGPDWTRVRTSAWPVYGRLHSRRPGAASTPGDTGHPDEAVG